MKVALIYPGKRSDDIQMPLGIGYLASYILSRNNDIEVQALDTSIATEKETRTFFNCDYDVVGVSVTSRGYREAVRIAKAFKEIKNHTLIVFGGPHISIVKKEILNEPCIDFGVYGEGELTFNELLRVVKEASTKAMAEALSEIKGLIYRRNGETVINPPREFIKNLDILPFPAINLFPIERYTGKFPMVTSRGCPFACVFCASSRIWNRRWRARSAKNVIDEVEYILNHFGTRPIDFHDAAFNVSIDRVNAISDGFISKKFKVPWGVRGFRVNIIDVNMAKKMHEAGCTHVAIGIESANPEMLIRIGKKETIEQIDKGINILREAGIEVLGQFMIGNPGETLETVKESIAYARNSNLSQAVFGASAVPFPSTDLWDYVNKHGKWLVDTDCTTFEELYPRVLFETPEFSKEDRLEAMRLVREAGFMGGKKGLTQKLYNIASSIWFNHIYGLLPRSMSYYIYIFLRKVKRILSRLYVKPS